MTGSRPKIFAPSKVAADQEKIEAYFRGERIYPTTIELDLTQLCSRSCPGCPYSVSRRPGRTLQLPFLDRLFAVLGPHTPGLVLSGGEATIVPHFPATTALARKRGFRQIAVISNGANIHQPRVQDALLENVTSVRVSLYDWQEGESEHFLNTLRKIEGLRNRIEREGSRLEIGASILTRTDLNHRYEAVGLRALAAGIDWLYFHPYCVDWEERLPKQADQTGVIGAIERLRGAAPPGADIQVPFERYSLEPLVFERLHGSHFLIQVGADGINYAGPECKYEAEAALLDLNEYLEDDFLWHPQRLERLDAITSDNYRFIGTKHRPVVFSDHIEKLKRQRAGPPGGVDPVAPAEIFSYPSII